MNWTYERFITRPEPSQSKPARRGRKPKKKRGPPKSPRRIDPVLRKQLLAESLITNANNHAQQ